MNNFEKRFQSLWVFIDVWSWLGVLPGRLYARRHIPNEWTFGAEMDECHADAEKGGTGSQTSHLTWSFTLMADYGAQVASLASPGGIDNWFN